MPLAGAKPRWLTFDCYGTLIQWDEGLLAAIDQVLSKHPGADLDRRALVEAYDRREHQLEQTAPYKAFRTIVGEALRMALEGFGLSHDPVDADILTRGISRMPPFPEVLGALGDLKSMGFELCVISNTDDDIIAGNIRQLDEQIDKVITAQQARAYKPSPRIFEHAYRALGVTKHEVVHVCASPHLDLAAARDMGFRCVWIDRGTGRRPLSNYVPDATFPTLDRVPEHFRSIGWG